MARLAVQIIGGLFFLAGLVSMLGDPLVGAFLLIPAVICGCADIIIGQLETIARLLDPAYRRAENERAAQEKRDAAALAEMRAAAASRSAQAEGTVRK